MYLVPENVKQLFLQSLGWLACMPGNSSASFTKSMLTELWTFLPLSVFFKTFNQQIKCFFGSVVGDCNTEALKQTKMPLHLKQRV